MIARHIEELEAQKTLLKLAIHVIMSRLGY
jgi:hypothetical protein